MDLNRKYGVDEALAAGTWVDVDKDGTKLLIAALPNPKYNRALEPHRQRYRALDEDIPETIYEQVIAETVLLGWEKVEDEGMEIEATPANRLKMLQRYPQFKALVLRQATLVTNFQRKALEAEIKN